VVAAAEVAAVAGFMAAEVAAAGSVAAEVAAAAGSASGSVAAGSVVARVARVAAHPGERAACAKSHDLTAWPHQGLCQAAISLSLVASLRSPSGHTRPSGKSKFASSPREKNISLYHPVDSVLSAIRSVPKEGRIAIVTDAGWNAVDAAAPGAPV
jgi:hypothetical protein